MATTSYTIVPRSYAKTALTSAVLPLSSVALFVPSFVISANGGNSSRFYLGDSGVSAGEGIAFNAREARQFEPFEQQYTRKSWYDLSQFYIRATVASQIATVTILNVRKDNT